MLSTRPTRWLGLFLLFLALPSLAQSTDAAWRDDLLKWRADHAADLQKPERWLSLIGLEWLKDGDNSFGADKTNAISIKAKAPAHIANFRLKDGKVSLLAPPGGFPKDVLLDGKPASEQPLRADDQPPRSKVSVGTVSLIVLHRGERYALRIWDSTTPTRMNFKGLHWYEPDPKFRIQARWTPYVPHKMVNVPTVLGTTLPQPSPGVAEFSLNGKTIRIEPVLEAPDSRQLFFILRDTTSQSTTYGAGRFLYTDFPSNGLDKPGELLLDLNRMENPPCAYTPYATCPLPPRQNRMPVAIPAGEKRFHE